MSRKVAPGELKRKDLQEGRCVVLLTPDYESAALVDRALLQLKERHGLYGRGAHFFS
jgi:hypothetical protein